MVDREDSIGLKCRHLIGRVEQWSMIALGVFCVVSMSAAPLVAAPRDEGMTADHEAGPKPCCPI
jgi:hypothetical protein